MLFTSLNDSDKSDPETASSKYLLSSMDIVLFKDFSNTSVGYCLPCCYALILATIPCYISGVILTKYF